MHVILHQATRPPTVSYSAPTAKACPASSPTGLMVVRDGGVIKIRKCVLSYDMWLHLQEVHCRSKSFS